MALRYHIKSKHILSDSSLVFVFLADRTELDEGTFDESILGDILRKLIMFHEKSLFMKSVVSDIICYFQPSLEVFLVFFDRSIVFFDSLPQNKRDFIEKRLDKYLQDRKCLRRKMCLVDIFVGGIV